MLPKIKESFQEKLRLVLLDLLNSLDKNIELMLAEHSAKGLIRSGNTIKRTMDFIAQGNSEIYQAVINHLETLDIEYNTSLEADIQALANSAHNHYKTECLPRFQKCTELAGKPNLYKRMLPEVEASMASDLAKFQNSLNAAILQQKQRKQIPLLVKILWGLEAVILLSSIFLAWMWFKDPGGNYEPIIVGLGLAMPIILVFIKIGSKKST